MERPTIVTNPTDPFVDDRLPNAGETFSIFTGGYGNNVTESNMVRDGSFVVIDRFGSTPGIMMSGGNNVAYDVGGTGVLGLIQWILTDSSIYGLIPQVIIKTHKMCPHWVSPVMRLRIPKPRGLDQPIIC